MLTPSVLAWLSLRELSGFCRTRNAERGYLRWRSSLICPECGCRGEVATIKKPFLQMTKPRILDVLQHTISHFCFWAISAAHGTELFGYSAGYFCSLCLFFGTLIPLHHHPSHTLCINHVCVRVWGIELRENSFGHTDLCRAGSALISLRAF